MHHMNTKEEIQGYESSHAKDAVMGYEGYHEHANGNQTRQPNTPTKHHLLSWAGGKPRNIAALATSGTAYLSLLVSNPSSAAIGINGFTLGSLSCVFSTPLQIPAGMQGQLLVIVLTGSRGSFTGVNAIYLSGVQQSITATCSGEQAAQVGTQYSGYITTVSGQTYPFTVTASS